MRAYVLASGVTIAPFGDPVAETFLAGDRLHEHQRRTLARIGIEAVAVASLDEVRDGDEHLLIGDDVFFSAGVVERFVATARRRGLAGAVLALHEGPFVRFTAPIQDLPMELDHAAPSGRRAVYGIAYLRRSIASRDDLATLPRVVVPLRERSFAVDLSTFGARGAKLDVPLCDGVVFHLRHWVHVWQANVFGLALRWAEVASARKLWLTWIFLRSLLTTTRSGLVYGFLGRFNVVGKGCLIHPTASVEGCILEDGVSIGANAQVRFSILGKGASVAEQAIVNASVVGEGTNIAQQAILNLSTVYPQSFVKTLQGGLVGSESFVGGRVRIYDLKLEGSIKVEHQGRFVDTGLNFLAGCIGHGASLSGPIWLAQGRAIPNGYRIIQHPRQVITKVPLDLEPGAFLSNQGGTLAPVDRSTPKPAAEKPTV